MKTGASRISFRLKIAMLAGLITGGIVLGAGILLWKLTYQFSLHGLDQNIWNLGVRNLQRQVGASHWERLEESLSFVSGEETLPQYALWAETRGRLVYSSSNWPEGLYPSKYARPWDERSPEQAPQAPERRAPLSASNPALPILSADYYTEFSGGKTWRMGILNNYYTNLAIAVDIEEFNQGMNQLKRSYYLVLPFALLLAVSGAWLIAQRSLRPIETLTEMVEGVTELGLDKRIEGARYEVEFQRLIRMYNQMMGRLEKAFDQAIRFSADASHELKTPLARLQAELEAALKNAPHESSDQKVYSSLLDEIGRLKGITEKLLLLSTSDSGKLKLTLEPVNLSEILKNVVEDCEARTEDRKIDSKIPDGVEIDADALLLEQAIQNLATNALRYSDAKSKITFSLNVTSEQVSIRVENSGTPISKSDQNRIFERFYRVDAARSSRKGGVGLGLSLSREIVRAHGGELFLEKSDPAQTVFVLELPL